jgi:enediyne biosynthesis protein E4
MLETVVLENVDGKSLKIHKLPIDVQFAPVFGSVTSDLNGDGLLDIILIGNDTHGETITGYTDASFGNVLLNLGNFQWKSVQPSESGFIANGDKRAIAKINLASGKEAFVISENGGPLQVIALTQLTNELK